MVGGGRGGGNSGIGVSSGPGRDSGGSSQGDQRHTVGSGGRGGETDGLVDGQRVGLPGGYGGYGLRDSSGLNPNRTKGFGAQQSGVAKGNRMETPTLN